MKINIILVTAVCLISFLSQAQMAVNTDGSAAGASAMLDVKSTTKGILVPRMTSAQRGAIVSPAIGLMVFQTNTPIGYYYYNGTAWKQVVDMVSSGSFPAANTLLTSDGTNWVAKSLLVNAEGGSSPFSTMQPYLAMNYCIALYGIWPTSSGSDTFIGEVELFAFSYAPNGWAKCNGQLLAISNYTALFSLIGTIYGGDGVTSFGLPDLRGRIVIHQGQGPGLSVRTIGDAGGAETMILTGSQLPAHTHTVTFQ